MILLPRILGMKYPLENVVRFFFKLGLDQRVGSVLELGCGNGNNLTLFYQYGWNVVGVDISPALLEQAEANFQLFDVPGCTRHFVEHDISKGLAGVIDGQFDVILLSGILPYILREESVRVLRDLHSLARRGAHVYLNVRSVGDYRFRRGEEVGHNSYRLAIKETGECGLINTFFHEHEISELLHANLGIEAQTMQVMHDDYQNIQCDQMVSNRDIIIWGVVGDEAPRC